MLAQSFYYTVKGMLKKGQLTHPHIHPLPNPVLSSNSRAWGGETAALSLPAKAMQAAFGKLPTSIFYKSWFCSSEVGVSECGVLFGDGAEAFDDIDEIFFIYIQATASGAMVGNDGIPR